MVQLQGVVPPAPVADSFNEVNRAKQEETHWSMKLIRNIIKIYLLQEV